MKILISGAGVAGLALALQLDPAKFDVVVTERAPEFRNRGYSILLWESGRKILKEIAGHSIGKALFPVESFDFYVGNPAQKIRSVDALEIASTICRQDMMDALAEEVSKRENVKIRFSDEILSIDQDEHQATVSFKNAAPEKYDLVILADGANSALRDRYFETKQTTEPYVVRYQWIKSAKKLKDIAICGLVPKTCYFLQTVGDRSCLGYYTDGDPEVEGIILENLNKIDWIRDAKIELDHETVQDFSIKTVSSHSGFKGRVILTGDAYHAHAPSIGYGTSLALEDSASIARILNEKDISTPEGLEHELHIYEKQRSDRVSSVYSLQDIMEKLGISDSALFLNVVAELAKLGGGQSLEFWLHKIVHYSVNEPELIAKSS